MARTALLLICLCSLLPLGARAQQAGKLYRIGYIQVATPEEQAHLTKAFAEGMRELGHVEGRNYVLESRFAMGKPERLPGLAADLVRMKVDVIVTGANPAIAATKQATAAIPVVMATSRDPVGSGFIASLARPGGNITGLSADPSPEVQGKRLEILKEAVPAASRLALLWNPAPPGAEIYRKTTEAAAGKLGVRMLPFEVRSRDDFEPAFAAIAGQRVDAVVVLPDPLFFTARSLIVPLATRHRLAAIFHAREFVDLGGLMSYGASLSHQFRQAAVFVDKILKGARPADLPVEQATRLELAINQKAAKALGLTLPQSLLVRADHLVE